MSARRREKAGLLEAEPESQMMGQGVPEGFTDKDMQDPELLREMAELMGEDADAAPPPASREEDELAMLAGSMGQPAGSNARAVAAAQAGAMGAMEMPPETDVSNVELTDADMEDPELAAEMAAMMGEDDDSDLGDLVNSDDSDHSRFRSADSTDSENEK